MKISEQNWQVLTLVQSMDVPASVWLLLIRRLSNVSLICRQLLEVMASLPVLTLADQTDHCFETVKNSLLEFCQLHQ